MDLFFVFYVFNNDCFKIILRIYLMAQNNLTHEWSKNLELKFEPGVPISSSQHRLQQKRNMEVCTNDMCTQARDK